MKTLVKFAVILVLVLGACSSQEKPQRLVEGTAAYQLARDLTATVPYLEPDANNVLVKTDAFTVSTGDVIALFHNMMGENTAKLKMIDAEALKKTVSDYAVQIAEQKLLLAAAEKARSAVAPEEISAAVQAQHNRAGGKEKFMETMKTQERDPAYIEDNVRKNLIIQKYLESFFRETISVSEEEIQTAYRADKTASVRHILLLTEGKTDEDKAEIRRKMEGILARARRGEDFAALAKEFSEDPGSKDNGGLYADFERGRMVPSFEEAAFSVPVGELSDIVETRYGYHILKIVERKKETRPLEEVREELESRLRQGRQNQAFENHIAKLKADVAFEIVTF